MQSLSQSFKSHNKLKTNLSPLTLIGMEILEEIGMDSRKYITKKAQAFRFKKTFKLLNS